MKTFAIFLVALALFNGVTAAVKPLPAVKSPAPGKAPAQVKAPAPAQAQPPALVCGANSMCENNQFTVLYQELGCIPNKTFLPMTCCPMSYDCSGYTNRPTNVCQYKGKTYPENAKLDAATIGVRCMKECICKKTGKDLGWSCTKEVCPALAASCVPVYASTSQCCPTCNVTTTPAKAAANTTKTPGKTPGKTPAKTPAKGAPTTPKAAVVAATPFQCMINNVSFREGEEILTDNNMYCLCLPGFDGTQNGTWCAKINCGLELIYQQYAKKNCSPIYEQFKYCPVAFQCPAPNDTVIRVDLNKTTDGKPLPPGTKLPEAAANKCVFGKNTMNWYDALNLPPNGTVMTMCSCYTPPYLTCENMIAVPPPPQG